MYSAVDWASSIGDRKISLSFPYIAVHAVSRDAAVFPFKPCIFLLYSVPDEDDPEQELINNYRLSSQEPEQCVSKYSSCTCNLHVTSMSGVSANVEIVGLA